MGEWNLQPTLTKETKPERGGKAIKIYADEDVEEWAIRYLKRRDVNIVSVPDHGNKGKEDPDVVAYAFKQKRTVLTKNKTS